MGRGNDPSTAARRLAGRLVAAAVLAYVALGCLASHAAAQTPVLLDPGGVSVAAYGGWSAWSRADGATGRIDPCQFTGN